MFWFIATGVVPLLRTTTSLNLLGCLLNFHFRSFEQASRSVCSHKSLITEVFTQLAPEILAQCCV